MNFLFFNIGGYKGISENNKITQNFVFYYFVDTVYVLQLMFYIHFTQITFSFNLTNPGILGWIKGPP